MCLRRRMCARLRKWLMVTHPLPNGPMPNPKQPVVDPKDIHGSLTIGNRIQHVQPRVLAHPQSNIGEHMFVFRLVVGTALWCNE